MEILGSFLDEEWESLSQIFSGEYPNFLLHCDGGGLFPATAETPSPTISPSDHAFPTNFFSDSQENSNTSEIDESLYFNIQENQDQQQLFFDHTTFDSINYDVIEEFLHLKGDDRAAENGDHRNEMQMKRKVEELDIEIKAHDDKSDDYSSQTPNKKPRNSRNAQKSRESQPKKSKKKIEDKNNEEERGNCISYSSEDDSNASQEKNPESKKSASSSKTRASRGSATDPQSLYARKRRERINERLRILQNLVPNGTKVDISTMLEEAVQYVKFLQLQIKLLSSDNMWMYAPLAYNGMDIGVYQNFCPNLSP